MQDPCVGAIYTRCLSEISTEDLREGKISVQDLYKSSVGKIAWQDLCTRPPGQDLYKRSLGKISLLDLCTLHKLSVKALSVEDLHKRSPCKISVQDLYKRSVGKISIGSLQTAALTLREPAQSKCASTFHKSNFIWKFTGKMPRPKTAAQTLCEPAQSKCMSTSHKSHFIRKLTGKIPRPSWSTLIKHRPSLLP